MGNQRVALWRRVWRWIVELPLVALALVALAMWVVSLALLAVVFHAADATGIDYNGDE